MNKVYIYIRKFNHIGTIVYCLGYDEAINIMNIYSKSSDYQIGILYGDEVDSLNKVYGEFAPYKEIKSKKYLEDILTGKKIDKFICKVDYKTVDKYILNLAQNILKKKQLKDNKPSEYLHDKKFNDLKVSEEIEVYQVEVGSENIFLDNDLAIYSYSDDYCLAI